jgi:hypothetical protein
MRAPSRARFIALTTLLLLVARSSAAPDSVAAILRRIRPPEIATRDFPVPKGSASQDGR